MVYLLIFAIGYYLGCISPASVLARRKQVDLRKEGSGNLGATNTALVLGRSAGAFVMIAVPAVILMLLLNTSVAVPILSGLLFPILVGFHSHDLFSVLISAAAGALIVFMHRDNLYKALTDTDVISARDYWKKVIRRKE